MPVQIPDHKQAVSFGFIDLFLLAHLMFFFCLFVVFLCEKHNFCWRKSVDTVQGLFGPGGHGGAGGRQAALDRTFISLAVGVTFLES